MVPFGVKAAGEGASVAKCPGQGIVLPAVVSHPAHALEVAIVAHQTRVAIDSVPPVAPVLSTSQSLGNDVTIIIEPKFVIGRQFGVYAIRAEVDDKSLFPGVPHRLQQELDIARAVYDSLDGSGLTQRAI